MARRQEGWSYCVGSLIERTKVRRSRRTLSSPPLTDTSKIQLYVEQLSLKKPGDWRNSSSTTKAGRMIHSYPRSLVGTEEKWSHWDPHPWWGTQKNRRISQARESFLGSEGFEPHIRHPRPGGPTPGRQAPLAGLEINEAYWRAVRSLDSALEERPHSLAYSQSQHGGSRLKTAWGSGQLARTTPVGPPASTRLQLQPLLLQHCSPLRWRLPLPMRVCTLRGNRARSDTAWPLTSLPTFRRSETSSWAETTITGRSKTGQ